MTLRISNRQARALIIEALDLARAPRGQYVTPQPTPSAPIAPSVSQQGSGQGVIDRMGFVQLDTIRAVSRAHHHILWSRDQTYREPGLWDMLSNRMLFEHFTHDASLLPIEFYPVWGKQFRRMSQRFAQKSNWNISPNLIAQVKDKIRREGPLSTHAFDTKVKDKSVMWARPPHKQALDYLWYIGELATSHRENFTKYYDIPERVIPAQYRQAILSDTQQIDRLCAGALARLIFATDSQLKAFWDVCNRAEVTAWRARTELIAVEVEAHDGSWMPAFALPDIEIRLENITPPTSRMRVLNPFDPLTRDRKRLMRLFGFEYKIEIFVPAAKRRWGYYVYPILEGARFVGRIDLKADRKAQGGDGHLNILAFWPEPDVDWTARRRAKLDSELSRLARFAGVKTVRPW